MPDWKKHFDAIYCIHYLPYKGRAEMMKCNLEVAGILDSGIYHQMNFFNDPFMANCLQDKKFLYPEVAHRIVENPKLFFKCHAHYCVWKQCLELGYERVMIIQDDVKFISNGTILDWYMQDFPDGMDFIQLEYRSDDPNLMKVKLENDHISRYFLKRGINDILLSTACYFFSKKMMQKMSYLFQNNVFILDDVFHLIQDVKMAIPTNPWCIQENCKNNPEKRRQYENAECKVEKYF